MSEELTTNKQELPKSNYWLHRITGGRNAFPIAKMLLENGYLSIGWADFSCDEFVTNVLDNGIDDAINKHAKSKQENFNWAFTRNRWSLWRFIKEMKAGDYIVVPTWKAFSIYVIEDDQVLTNQSFSLKECSKELPKFDGTYLRDEQNNVIDLGFYRKVKAIGKATNIPRKGYADQLLFSRMKIMQTNANITDIYKSVDDAITRAEHGNPICFYKELLDSTQDNAKKVIDNFTQHITYEDLVGKYLQAIGADDVQKPPQNESKTEEGDADRVAYFEDLKVAVMVQVKKHSDKTNAWSVEQITRYLENHKNEDYNVQLWVISNANDFTEDAKQKAFKNSVRLINGDDFARMILEVGLKHFE